MAAFTVSCGGAQAQLIQAFPLTPRIPSIPPLTFSPSTSRFRCKVSRRLQQINQRLFIVSATNPNSKVGKSPYEEGSDVKETSNAAQGPPFLTILAGFLVFFLVCWIIGSIIMWLISLIVNAPLPK